MGVKPKVVLDKDLLETINRHYSSYLGEEILGRECFSDPKLESHFCNPQANKEGDKVCEHCGGIPGRPCPVTCDIHHFCLAVFASRLGVGTTARKKAGASIKDNLGRDYKSLYSLVVKQQRAIEEAEKEGTEAPPPKDETQLELPVESPSEKRPKRKRPEGPVLDDDGSLLITIKEAAELYGSTYVNIHAFVTRKRLRNVRKDGVIYVRKTEIEALRDRKKR